ncbi:SDR family oxidoreductase [Nocardia sp. NPDC051570]|uniref:SDR family oxidoreductase n=1 Tax=Nocardia sp. NPDC051570 TaxID=3364324 RepID=UPI00379EB8CE
MYNVPDQTGKTFVITGANSGTGKEAAARLAGAGAQVIMAVRTPEKGERAKAEILADHPAAELEVRRIDLADLDSVRRFADELIASGQRVDVLVNNAGVMAPPTRHTTAEGFELQFGSNYLGPFALTMLLLPTLLRADRPRVTTMSSGTAWFGHIRLDDPQWERRRYSPALTYAQSKLADLMLSVSLSRVAEERGWALSSTAAHPGYTHTNLQTAGASLGRETPGRSILSRIDFLPSQQVRQGAEPLLFAAADPAARSGEYYGPSGRFGLVGPTGTARIPRRANNAELGRRLWAEAERLTGTRLPA